MKEERVREREIGKREKEREVGERKRLGKRIMMRQGL